MHQAPGEAEAELAKMNVVGLVDAVFTSDCDALVFGARCVIRRLVQADS
jgi:Holliday junction resolvase YEN1